MVISVILSLALFAFIVYWIWLMNKPKNKVPSKFPAEWRELLHTHVHFYQNLDQKEKQRFEKKVIKFLKQVRITGIKTEVEDLDKLLVASSGVIPLFGFPSWNYNYLHEVLLYPASFDRQFDMEDPKEVITGMVGSGQNMEGVMILSKESLRHGFANTKDKLNTAIHEFVHILDKQDGAIDGVPGVLNDKEYAKPWLKLMSREMEKIKKGESDINEYGATTEEEFLAVASEYFFERPKLFQQNHPKLYNILKKVYHQDMVKRLQQPYQKQKRIGRNDSCPCGSGEKFKNCCLKE